MTHTTREWLDTVLNDSSEMERWLKAQYHGEATAAVRIAAFADEYAAADPRAMKTLKLIAAQEGRHAEWVAGLLTARGIVPEVDTRKRERYWNKTLPGITSLESGAAVAAHAEGMRLVRIRAIIEHPDSPEDIREVFQKILPEEEFHERAFSELSTHEDLLETAGNHEVGQEALGLVV